MERKYSVSEIARMRNAVQCFSGSACLPMTPEENTTEVEQRLRTYMLNGTDPEELERYSTDFVLQKCGGARTEETMAERDRLLEEEIAQQYTCGYKLTDPVKVWVPWVGRSDG